MVKKLLMMAATLLFLVAVAAVVVPYFIPSNTFRTLVINKVETMTGRVMTIGGRLRVKLFPIAGVYVENVTLTNPPRYHDLVPVVTLESMEVEVALLPLIRGTIEIRKLDLQDPHINLHVSENGIHNWLLRPENHPTMPDNYYPANRPRAHIEPAVGTDVNAGFLLPPLPGNLLLSDIRVRGGTLTYVNDADKSRWDVKNLDADIGLNGLSSPLNVSGSGVWNGKKIAVKSKLSTLQSLMGNQRTQAETDISGDLGSMGIDGFIERTTYVGKLAMKTPSLKEVIRWLNPSAKFSGPAPLALRLGSDIECTMESCNFTNASLVLDAIEAKGNVKAIFAKDMPQLAVDLTTNVLDLNPFLEGDKAASASLLIPDAAAEAASHWSDAPINLASLKTVNVTAGIKAEGLVFHHFTVGKTSLRVGLQHGRLAVDAVDADMYEGKGNMSLVLDGGATTPTFENSMFLKGVQVAPLLKDSMNITNVSGTADIQITANGSGRSEKDLISSLAGNGKFKLNNGSIKGVSLLDVMRKAQGGGDSGGATPINQMDGTFTIKQGVISNRDLVMAMPGLNVGGQGDISLPAYSINYRLAPQMIRGQGKTAQEGISVPVLVVGSLDHPRVQADVQSVIQNAIQNPDQFRQQLKNSKGGLKDQLKGLKGLLKGN